MATKKPAAEPIDQTPMQSIPTDLMRLGAAANLLGVHLGTLYRWCESGHLPSYRIGPKQRRVSRADVLAMVRVEPQRPKITTEPRWQKRMRDKRTAATLARHGIIV